MTRTIAFFRALNVPHRMVRMEDLRSLLALLGFQNVSTYIQSGNAIFDTADSDLPALERLIESQLEEALGFPVATFLRSGETLAALSRYQPFETVDPADDPVLYVAFVHEPPDENQRLRLSNLENQVDHFHVFQNHVFWLRRRALGKSQFSNAVLERVLGMPATIRSMTTVRKIAARLSG